MTTPAPLETDRKAGPAWLLVLIWTATLLWAGGGDTSADVTSRFIGPFLRWLLPDAAPETLGRIHFFIRKGAHLVEYGLLALLVLFALLASIRTTVLRLALPALGWVLAVAACDEIRQTTNPTRTGSARDVVLDLFGATLALALAFAYTRWTQARRAAPERE